MRITVSLLIAMGYGDSPILAYRLRGQRPCNMRCPAEWIRPGVHCYAVNELLCDFS